MKVTFVMGKHPYAVEAGDTRMARLVIDAAAQSASVGVIALGAEGGPSPIPVTSVPKPPVRLARTFAHSVAHGRSLIHSRFMPAPLIRALASDSSDALVAEHVYMAEAPLAAGRGSDGTRLLINSHVLESDVLRRSRGLAGPLLRLEGHRTARDELRCVNAAASTACFGQDDMDTLAGRGATNLCRLDTLLEPADAPASATTPRALFLGGRDGWAPNREALERMLAVWPGIKAAVPAATLTVAGNPGPRERPLSDPGIETLGFVPDLDELWRSVSVLLAPVTIGGGVRVKILDAVRHGVAVVATAEALGSIGEYLPITACRDNQAFSQRAVALLSDPARARSAGHEAYEAARGLWREGFVEKQVERWISGK